VSIDGVDIRDMTLDSLAATVGLVSQETYLFHASIRENLRFACPQASDEEIEDAARAAQIHELISSLPEGYDTPVGERGYRFSGGEKQRIAIARTVLRNPPVLILDEATSALDTRPSAPSSRRSTSSRADAPRSPSPTASRRSATPTRSSCSTPGSIVERGTHEELLELGGRYAALLSGAEVARAARKPSLLGDRPRARRERRSGVASMFRRT
jgi:ATP-binding cassette subfamily B protein